jgi:hypothetical protein
VRTLEGVIAEHDAIKREVGLLRALVEKTTNNDARNHEREEEEFGAADDDARRIGTIIPHELESVKEEDEDQIEKQEQQLEDEEEEWMSGRVELGRLRTPEPMGLGITHLSDEEDTCSRSPRSPSVIDKLFQRLTTPSSKLGSAVELLSSLQA